ncbi:MAG: hypothetical protein KGI80_00835 [Verrucomicrobiota bacterium]|nr:hypothetical protein [Verrucomicrobiota bacterium]
MKLFAQNIIFMQLKRYMCRFASWFKKLRIRRIIGIAFITIGSLLISFVNRSTHKVEKAKKTIDYLGDFFTNDTGIWNPVVEFFGGQVRQQVSKYDTTLTMLLVLGIALIVVGLITVFWPGKKSS